jgi:hypothetical protein
MMPPSAGMYCFEFIFSCFLLMFKYWFAFPGPPSGPPSGPPAPAAAPGMGALLGAIQGFGKNALKKVETVDKSSGVQQKSAGASSPASAAAPANKPAVGGGGGGGGGGGDMMSALAAKLAARKANDGSSEPAAAVCFVLCLYHVGGCELTSSVSFFDSLRFNACSPHQHSLMLVLFTIALVFQ